ncbi:Uncharacterised protein [uncultured archaeon]|nr:Uncharacterised protein [uncultured archaeon]
MNRNIVLELFLIVSIASIWISGAFAMQQYLDTYNTTFSTNGTCSICHVNPAGGGTLNSYGMNFSNQPNHSDVAGGGTKAALTAIGQAPAITSTATTTATSMVTTTSTATSMVTATSTATSAATAPPLIATPVSTETQMPIVTQVITTPAPTPTPSTPGFGLGVFIAGLLACYFILKRHNN